MSGFQTANLLSHFDFKSALVSALLLLRLLSCSRIPQYPVRPMPAVTLVINTVLKCKH